MAGGSRGYCLGDRGTKHKPLYPLAPSPSSVVPASARANPLLSIPTNTALLPGCIPYPTVASEKTSSPNRNHPSFRRRRSRRDLALKPSLRKTLPLISALSALTAFPPGFVNVPPAQSRLPPILMRTRLTSPSDCAPRKNTLPRMSRHLQSVLSCSCPDSQSGHSLTWMRTASTPFVMLPAR